MRSDLTPRRGISLEDHDTYSTVLVAMAHQDKGFRTALPHATGKPSAPAQAAEALAEAVLHLQQCLLAQLDQDFGEQAPWMTRTRYCAGAVQQAKPSVTRKEG